MPRKILIIQTGSTRAADVLATVGDFDRMFLDAMGLDDHGARVVRVFRDETLPEPGAVSGVLITGSPAMVTDREPWSERTAAWLRGAVGAGHPVLGVCYGHQLLVHALGGEVGGNPRGPEYGAVTLDVVADTVVDPLLSALGPGPVRVFEAHYQSALKLPQGAHAVARSDGDPHQAVRYAANVWSVQFHPEFSAEIMRGILEADRPGLEKAGIDVDGLIASADPVGDGPGRRLLKRFRELCSH